MPARYISDLAGTLWTSFRIGVNRFVASSGVLAARNAADSADVALSASQLQAKATAAAGMVTLAAPSSLATDVAFVLPAADGATNQAIVTDGAGNLSFMTTASGSNAVKAEDQVIAYNEGSPTSIVTLPAGATIQRVIVEVETAFDGSPSLSVGVTGTASKYMGATDMDLATAAMYEVAPMIEEAGSVEPLVTYAAGGATVGSARVTVQWVLPG